MSALRLLAETLPHVVWVMSPDGRVTYANRRWVDYTGLPAGGRWTTPFHPDDRPRVRAAWTRATEVGADVAIEARSREVGDTYHWWSIRATPLRDPSGAIVEWFATGTDIDDVKRTEAQLRQAQKLAAIGRVASGIAHDFNNMLTVILNYATFASRALPAASPIRGDLEEILRAGERAAGLTHQLLAFCRNQQLPPSVLDLGRAITGMRNTVRCLLGDTVTLSLRAASPSGKINMHPTQLEQIVMNLAANARDAMPRGGTLALETSTVELDAGAYVKLAVSDTGVGMDRPTRARIFEPFFTTKPTGTGLGLSTVFELVQQHDGHIRVHSEPGTGTTFELYLPRAR